MKDGIPIIYWTFRSAWTALHFLVVLVTAIVLLWWAVKGGNADRLFETARSDLLDVQRRVASAIPWPWS
jgi:hypothetical protein